MSALVPWSDGVDGFSLVFRVQALVPTFANDGSRFPQALFAEFEAHVTSVTDAFSRREGAVLGNWTLNVVCYGDRNREYFIDVADPILARDLAVAVSHFILRRFGQRGAGVDVSSRFSTVYTPAADLLALDTPFRWEPLPPRRSRFLPLLGLLALLVFSGCERAVVQQAAASVRHAVAPPVAVPLTVDIVVDAGDGAASPEGVAATIRAAADAGVSRPGSVVRLFQVGESRVSESRLIAGYVFPAPPRPSRRAVLLHERAHRDAANRSLLRASERLFAERSRRQTRIAETLSIVGLAGNPSRGTRVIVIESDLRETSIADLECTIPQASAFIERLDAAGLLRPGSLRATTVWFAHARPNDVEADRCPSSVRHFTDLTTLWRVVLERAGARVFITSGVPEVSR